MKALLVLIFWRTLFVRYTTIAAILLQTAMWVLLVWKFLPIASGQDFVSLHYNIYFGIDLIGAWYNILAIPIAGLIFLTVNAILIVALFNKEKFLSYFLAGCNVLINFGLLTALTLIILLNI